MIGKIFFEKKWKLICFDEKKKTLIFLNSGVTSESDILKTRFISLTSNQLIPVYMENGLFYLFDIGNAQQTYDCLYEIEEEKYINVNFFKQPTGMFEKLSNSNSFKKVTFINGVLKSIIGQRGFEDLSFNINFSEINADIKFFVNEKKDNISYKINNCPTMLTNLSNVIHQYKLEIIFKQDIDINKLNKIIDCIYKFLSFLSFTTTPYIETIQVENSICTWDYIYEKINYDENFSFRFVYAKNFKNKIKTLLEYIVNSNNKLSYLNTLNSLNNLTIQRIWELSFY